MKMTIINDVNTDWAEQVEEAVKKALATLETIPMMKKHMPSLDCVYLFDNPYESGKQQCIRGSYSTCGIIKLCVNRLDTITEAVYVFLHEFAHHVANQLAGLDSEYDSKKENNAYFKEEIRADALAMMLLKKYFNQSGQFSALIKTIKRKVCYMVKRFKGEDVYWQGGYFYTLNSSSWDFIAKRSNNLSFAA